jgi:hypothetical protein
MSKEPFLVGSNDPFLLVSWFSSDRLPSLDDLAAGEEDLPSDAPAEFNDPAPRRVPVSRIAAAIRRRALVLLMVKRSFVVCELLYASPQCRTSLAPLLEDA